MDMNFFINFNNFIGDRVLEYISDEYSFIMKPTYIESTNTISINYIEMILNNNREVIYLSGFCPLNCLQTEMSVPDHKKGILNVKGNMKSGLSYSIGEDVVWPLYKNEDTHWICVGNLEARSIAVEFLTNCVAVIENNKLVSIWLKPNFI